MRRILLLTLLCCMGERNFANAQSYIQQCAASLQIDKTVIQNNFAARMSFLEQIDSTNFEDAKKRFDLAGLLNNSSFNGSFTDFTTKMNRLQSLVQSTSGLDISSAFAQYALSQAGANAFSECVRTVSKQPIAAFVEVATREVVVVRVIKLDPFFYRSTNNVNISVSGGKELGKGSRVFINNSETTYTFTREIGQPFIASFNLMKNGSGVGGAVIIVPKYITVRLQTTARSVTSNTVNTECGGNGRGDTTRSTPATITADPGWRLDLKTIVLDPTNAPGPGEGNQSTGAEPVGAPDDQQYQAVAVCNVIYKDKAGRVSLTIRGQEVKDELIVEK